MYTIMVNGGTYRYETLEEAKRVADEIFQATGVIVGVERRENDAHTQA